MSITLPLISSENSKKCAPFAWSSVALVSFFFVIAAQPSQAALYNLSNASPSYTDISINGGTGTVNIPISTFLGTKDGVGTQYPGAVVNGAIIVSAGNGAGSGTYRKLYGLKAGSNGPVLDGYNREIDNKVTTDFETQVSGFDPVLTVGNLVNFNGYFQFSVDINESNSTGIPLSIDDFRVYLGGPSEPNPLPALEGDLDDLGTVIWDFHEGMTGGEKNHILTEGSGSGVDDISFLIPANLFGSDPDAQVYIYSKIGALGVANELPDIYDGYGKDGGFAEWATLKTGEAGNPFVTPVPELSSGLPTLFLLTAGLFWRSRRRLA